MIVITEVRDVFFEFLEIMGSKENELKITITKVHQYYVLLDLSLICLLHPLLALAIKHLSLYSLYIYRIIS